jgi:hypothetical protein
VRHECSEALGAIFIIGKTGTVRSPKPALAGWLKNDRWRARILAMAFFGKPELRKKPRYSLKEKSKFLYFYMRDCRASCFRIISSFVRLTNDETTEPSEVCRRLIVWNEEKNKNTIFLPATRAV